MAEHDRAGHDVAERTIRGGSGDAGAPGARALPGRSAGRARPAARVAVRSVVATAVASVLLAVTALVVGSVPALGAVRPDIPPPPSERSTTTTEPAPSTTAPSTTVRRSGTTGDDPVSQAQLADVNQRLDRATSTATIALVLAVAALLLAAIGVVLSRTGRRRPTTGAG